MRCIYKGRGEGKTTDLIKECAADGKYNLIVCVTQRECERVSRQANVMGVSIPHPITFAEFVDGRFDGRRINAFYIDNADMLLLALSRGVPIRAVSITSPEPMVPNP